jgi:hypothetical protein
MSRYYFPKDKVSRVLPIPFLIQAYLILDTTINIGRRFNLSHSTVSHSPMRAPKIERENIGCPESSLD